MTPHGHFNWNELVTRDAERVKRFYQEQIGWSYEGKPLPGGGTYWTAMMNGAPVGVTLGVQSLKVNVCCGKPPGVVVNECEVTTGMLNATVVEV